MTTVTIDNRSYPCPSAWNEIGWEQFFTLAEYAGQTVGTSATERKAERVLERICGVDPGKMCIRDRPQDIEHEQINDPSQFGQIGGGNRLLAVVNLIDRPNAVEQFGKCLLYTSQLPKRSR